MKNNHNRQYKKTSLEFRTQKQATGRKKFTTALFVLVGIIIIGSISLLLFLKEYDFDFNNIVGRDARTTQATTEVTTEEPLDIQGEKTFLLLCSDDENKNLHFVSLVKADLSKGKLVITPVDVLTELEVRGYKGSLNEIFGDNSGSMLILKDAVEKHTDEKVDRYIHFTDTSFKGMIKIFGGVVADVKEKISYSYKGVGYIIDEGKQTLTADIGYKYMFYLSQQHGNDTQKTAEFLSDIFKSILKEDNISYIEGYYKKLRNIMDTDISAFDFSNGKQALEAFIGKFDENGTEVHRAIK